MDLRGIDQKEFLSFSPFPFFVERSSGNWRTGIYQPCEHSIWGAFAHSPLPFCYGRKTQDISLSFSTQFLTWTPGGRYNLGAKAMICWNWKKEISLQCSSNIAWHDTSDTLPASSFPCDCEELTSPSQCIHEISNVSLVTSSIFFPRRYKCSFCLEVTVSSPMSFSLFCQRSASVPLWDLTKFLYVSNVHVIFMGC